LNLHVNESEPYIQTDGSISHIQLGVYDDISFNVDSEDWGNEEVYQGQSFSFYIYSINQKYVSDEDFDWVIKGGKLHKVINIDDLEENEEIVFKFIYEYLKLNPKDYFWVENDWVYTLEDMERFSKLPFDESWCYKNPNDRNAI
jgi:hypothetical protein